jgi:hypothetical protein
VSPLAGPLAVCGRLRLDDVVDARQAGARLVVSAPTSPFCHAANVLRYWSARGHNVAWRVSSTLTADDRFCIVPAGSWLASSKELTLLAADGSCRQLPTEKPRVSHAGELTIRALEADVGGVVAMGGKRYDRLTAALMAPGLSESAEAVAREPVDAIRLSSGHLALLSSRVARPALCEIATDPARAKRHLDTQQLVYEEILDTWALQRTKEPLTRADLATAAGLIRQFFSVLLVLHETYTYVIQMCLDQLDPMMHDDLILSAIPAILSWQCDAGALPSAQKSIFDTAGEMPTPPLDLKTDLALTTSAITKSVANRDLSLTWRMHFARVMVLKEWKFYIAKIVHRHFGRVFAALSTPVARAGGFRPSADIGNELGKEGR